MSDSIRLHRKLYTHPSVEAAKTAYKDLAVISIETEGEYYVLTFEEIDPDVEEMILAEFANYALAETIEERH